MKWKTDKYGLEVPNSIEDALHIDCENSDTFQDNALTKDVENIGLAFDIISTVKHVPPGWTKAIGNIIFNVKIDLPARLYK